MIPKDENLNKNQTKPQEKFLTNFSVDSFCYCHLGNTFCIFQSINNALNLIYTGENKAIIIYDLNDNKKLNEIKNAHKEYITDFKHFLDKNKKMDLIMTTSTEDNNIKIWNFHDFECLLNLEKIYDDGLIYSPCFFTDNNQQFIIVSNCNWDNHSDKMKVFDLNGKQIKEIDNLDEQILFTDVYDDNMVSKKYIIVGTTHCAKSYDYDNNEVYHEYSDVTNVFHLNIIIYNKDNITQLIASCHDGFIRIWDFHETRLLKKIFIVKGWLYGICLWKDEYLLVGYYQKIKLIDLKNGESIETIEAHNDKAITIKKFIHPKYGEFFVSQGFKRDQIKLWVNKK